MKIRVDHLLCQGHARCYALAPGIFALDDAGYILAGDIAVPEGQEALARRGARACPERALIVEGEDGAA
jgi:ferredoxin